MAGEGDDKRIPDLDESEYEEEEEEKKEGKDETDTKDAARRGLGRGRRRNVDPRQRMYETGYIKALPSYTGDKDSPMNLSKFFRQFDTVRQLRGWNDEVSLLSLKLHMEGPAADCFDAANPQTLEEARAALERRFAYLPGLSEVLGALAQPVQRDDEDGVMFLDRLIRLRQPSQSALEEGGLGDVEGFLNKTLLATLRRGLKSDRVREKLMAASDLKELEEARTLVQNAEREEKEYYSAHKAKGVTVGALQVEDLRQMIEATIIRVRAQEERGATLAAVQVPGADKRPGRRPGLEKRWNKGGTTRFEGKCYVCGKSGHKASECWNRKWQGDGEKGRQRKERKEDNVERNKRTDRRQGAEREEQEEQRWHYERRRDLPTPRCFHCNKEGHYKRNCWERNGRIPKQEKTATKNEEKPLSGRLPSASGEPFDPFEKGPNQWWEDEKW